MPIVFCTRESVKSALDEAETARSNAQVDSAILAGARDVEGLCLRPEYALHPVTATYTFDWPPRNSSAPSWKLRFEDGRTLITATAVTTDNGATTLTPGTWFPTPQNEPRYTGLEVDLGGSAVLSSGSTYQRAIGVAGLWGWSYDLVSVGTLGAIDR